LAIVVLGEVGYDLSAVLVDDGPMPKDAFQRLWQSAPADKKADVSSNSDGNGDQWIVFCAWVGHFGIRILGGSEVLT